MESKGVHNAALTRYNFVPGALHEMLVRYPTAPDAYCIVLAAYCVLAAMYSKSMRAVAMRATESVSAVQLCCFGHACSPGGMLGQLCNNNTPRRWRGACDISRTACPEMGLQDCRSVFALEFLCDNLGPATTAAAASTACALRTT